jgi:hypothetical protein
VGRTFEEPDFDGPRIKSDYVDVGRNFLDPFRAGATTAAIGSTLLRSPGINTPTQ